MDSTAVTRPKKLSNGHRSFAGGSVYDGVFGSPAKIRSGGCRVVEEDYREIFSGGSRSSIPFLDVPELSESKVSVDVRSSKLDYSAIFGGVADSSFPLRYDELSSEPNRRKKSEEQRTTNERLSPPEASENSSCTEDSNAFSPEPSNQMFDGVKKFKMSYNRVSSENSNGTGGTAVTTHIAQLNAVQGFAHLINEVDEVVKPETESVPKGKSSFRASPDVSAETRKQNLGGDVEFRSPSNWFKTNSMDGSLNCGNKGSKIGSGEGSTGSCSPPYFGDEVDINSVAATSAAALRKAIDDAQAKIKMAKEIMERKKAGLGNGAKSFRDSSLRPEANRPKKNKTREICEEMKIPSRASSETEQEKTKCLFQVSSGVEVKERVPSSEIPNRADRMWEEAEASEAEQFYDVEDIGENWPLTAEVETPHVSVVLRGQNVSSPGQANADSEVEKIVSGVKESDREANHRQKKAVVVNIAKKFPEEISDTDKAWDVKAKLEEAKVMQCEEKSCPSQRNEELSNEGPKPADGLYSQEEIEKRIQLINGSMGMSDQVTMQDSKVDNKEEEEEQEEQSPLEVVQAFHETETFERSSMEFVEPVKIGKLLEIRVPEDTRHAERELTRWECSGSGKNGDEYWEQEGEREKEDSIPMFVNKPRKNKWMERRLESFHLGQEIARVLSQDVEPEENEKIHECDSSDKEEETIPEESDEWVVATRMTNLKSDADEGDEDDMKASVEETTNGEYDIEPENNTAEKDGNDDTSKAQEPIVHAETHGTTQVSEVGWRSVDELRQAFSENNHVTEENDVQKAEYFPMVSELAEILKPSEYKTESVSEGEKTMDKPASQLEIVHESTKRGEEVASEVEKFEEDKEVKVSEINVSPEDDETSSGYFVEQELVDDESKMEDSQSPEHGDVELVKEMRTSPSREKDHEEAKGSQEVEAKESQSVVHTNKESDEDAALPVKEPEKDHEEAKGSQEVEAKESQSAVHTNKESDEDAALPVKEPEKDHEEAKGSQEVEANESQSAVHTNKESDEDATLPVKEPEKESSANEKEIPRRVDSAKERDREIEKGRLAVERAVREARERAFAEARDRALAEVRERVVAGRAATEARQRVATEAREKIGKASAEINAKSVLSEKASREAKLKAERAAVDRATSEARARALEKAMSSKAASEARKQNPEHQGSSSTSTSRYPSSNHDVSKFAKKSNGVNEESAQRCKARLERHQRISERAQKALAEMNNRDLLAQREQAERNRLAETLDIEVKRWSNGKEGNLRALLSTLQYILGPDSGWQPIPLTDVIKSAAVKKAYRKATLFVHPDKLQQRGANIQQKYTCEKVFDLLKEAWNKFNVEER